MICRRHYEQESGSRTSEEAPLGGSCPQRQRTLNNSSTPQLPLLPENTIIADGIQFGWDCQAKPKAGLTFSKSHPTEKKRGELLVSCWW
ncbi:hypothetical protein CEXT_346961 [Caerostris extrusa]|uniref:THAP-type domain-containing protein n=1 Tax=Caerostris extrusa TaxID=172846 RepID=A0AAV4THX5_CAEEX|nr:hypothetical protein CEXT_346961 [Caerostris extrusa]